MLERDGLNCIQNSNTNMSAVILKFAVLRVEGLLFPFFLSSSWLLSLKLYLGSSGKNVLYDAKYCLV